ncbi:MAG: response regulator [Elusimicrobia bacterium]|nr:response regulator [Elusimicrobiota bacterium]
MNNSAKILVVDDERGMREMLAHELGKQGYRVATAQDGRQALERLRDEDIQLVISDVKMPNLGGLEALAAIKKINPDVEVILATGYATVDDAVEAMKHGAYDFIQKPFHIDALLALVEKALEKRELKAVVGLYEASKAMFQTIKLDELLPLVARLTRSVLRADEVQVMLLNDGRLETAAALGAVSLREGASLVHPLRADGETFGELRVGRASRADPFNAADERHMTIFGAQLAQAVYNARMVKRLQEAQGRLIHSERMNAVGRLASGVAHELNNPLASLLGFAQLLIQESALSAGQRKDVDCIMEQGQRCKTIVSDLLQFGRKREPKKEVVPVASLVESVLRLARLDIDSKRIQISVETDDPDAAILADAFQMQQVFLNLILNAAHAVEDRQDKRLAIKVASGSGRTLIRFTDNGSGMPSEVIGKIFEPFFTTKPAGKGTGLGLAVCRDIVLAHGGAINAASAPGQGATFTVDLAAAASRKTETAHLSET